VVFLTENEVNTYSFNDLSAMVREAQVSGCEAELMEGVVSRRLDAVLYSKETHEHIARVAACSAKIAAAMGLPDGEVQLIRKASVYHDVGKHEVPDALLNKPGPLNSEERKIMETHALRGWSYLMVSVSPIYQAGAEIAKQHHERWNGSGYPEGLRGRQIHLYGRIVAVADVYDALITERVYKKPWPLDHVLYHFEEMSGILYDPEVIQAFLRLHGRL
jgi:putative two-component system response regulator